MKSTEIEIDTSKISMTPTRLMTIVAAVAASAAFLANVASASVTKEVLAASIQAHTRTQHPRTKQQYREHDLALARVLARVDVLIYTARGNSVKDAAARVHSDYNQKGLAAPLPEELSQ